MNSSFEDIKKLTNEIIYSFSTNARENNKWTLLNMYYSKYLLVKDFDKTVTATYISILSALVDSLHPTLFSEKWQEILLENFFLHGVLHESFLILVKKLNHSEGYAKQKMINLLRRFVRCPHLESLFLYQCTSSRNWDLKYVSQLNVWDHLVTALVSLPDRISNKTRGTNMKVFRPTYYVPLLLATVFRVLRAIYDSLKNSRDCSLEFLAKLTGRICLLGQGDIVVKMYLKEFLNNAESDYIWQRISQNFIQKMPSNSLDSFVTNLLLQTPWYGCVEWILGDEGMKNEKINYIMTAKLLFLRSFKNGVILQNSIGYFASSSRRVPHFIKILDSLLDAWTDEMSPRHQNTEQKIYVASALTVCAGWMKVLRLELDHKSYIHKVLKGTQIRLGSSEDTVRSLGMIVGNHLIQALDPDAPALKYECPDLMLVTHFEDMLKIPLRPSGDLISLEDLKCFEELSDENIEENVDKEADSDDDLEPYDMSNDVSESKEKRPLYLRDCMMGLIQQEDVDWTEKCLRHAQELIKGNPHAAEEVAEEMTKILLHLTDNSSIPDFVGLRHNILITLTVQCPLLVPGYLTSQFTEKDHTVRQRLDILEVLAASSALLAYSSPSQTCPVLSDVDPAKREPDWQIIVRQRLEDKTKRYTKAQTLPEKENKFSVVAGNFFYPLLNSYEKACRVLKLHGDDSYVLGRLIYTLGIIMCSASNTLHCSQMGTSLLEFLYSVRDHADVFVRKSVVFAVAATYTAVPSSLLFTDMLPEVTQTADWLKSVAENDTDPDCVEKALCALSLFHNAASEGSLLYQLKGLAAS